MATPKIDFHAKGMEALSHAHFFLARVCFEHAAVERSRPDSSSYLAFCQAKTRGASRDAVLLAGEALALEPTTALHYLNLGRIHLLAGNRKEALDIFRQGIHYDADGEIFRELQALGTRQPVVFSSLPRRHPLNRILGFLLRRFRSR